MASDDADAGGEYPQVSSKDSHRGGHEIIVRRMEHFKVRFRLLHDELGPVIEELRSLQSEGPPSSEGDDA